LSQQTQQQISPQEREDIRALMERDPWYFSRYVCGRDPKAERHHRPLLYVYTRKADLLCACLSNPRFDGPITDQVKADLRCNGIDWTNPADLPKVRRRLRRVNVRLPRSLGKSTYADDADLYEATFDPNITISIGSKSDKFAESRIITIGAYVLSPQYRYWFPERVPDDARYYVTNDAIWLKGRTRIVPEATIEGRGIQSQWTGHHYRKNRRDDIVGTESGEASQDDAVKHLANIDPLHDETAWVQDLFIGTINGEDDDHAILASDPNVMSIVVPIETHPGGTTLENIYSDGEIMFPEWFSRERVNEIKENARKNPKQGPIWLLQNYYMTAHQSGVLLFTDRVMERAKFIWWYDPKLKREIILRPLKDKRDTPRKMVNGYPQPVKWEDWFRLDLRALPRSAFAWAADQSVSDTGDEWAFVLGCMDWEGVEYILDNLSDHGYGKLIDQILPFDRHDATANIKKGLVPKGAGKIGIDTNATQGMTVEWLGRTPDYRALVHRLVKITSSNEAKDAHIRRWLLARMMAGDCYVNPRLFAFINECLKYRPRKPDGTIKRNAVDNNLDAAWMMCTLPRRPISPEELDEEAMELEIGEMLAKDHTDQLTGVSTDDWMQAMWSN
jgi:hypothetical protein